MKFNPPYLLNNMLVRGNNSQQNPYLHGQSAFQSVGIRTVDWQQRKWHYKRHYLFSSPIFFIFSVVTFSHRRSAYLAKVDLSTKKSRGTHFCKPCQSVWAHYWPFWILKALWRCRWWASSPGNARLLFYSYFHTTIPPSLTAWKCMLKVAGKMRDY